MGWKATDAGNRTMSAEKPVVVRITRSLEASPERVFDAWLDPEKARKFLFRDVDGSDGAGGHRCACRRRIQLHGST